MVSRAMPFVMLLAMGALSACGDDPAEPIDYVRAIKTFTVTEVASGQVRKYSGTVIASSSSALSFEVGGKVRKVTVKLGNRVKKGQVLAELDKKPYKLDVQAVQADLRKARAVREQARAEHERQKTLYAKGWIAKARLDQTVQNLESSNAQVNYAVSKLSLANRNLRNTTLRAPFNGYISGRYVDPFVEVKAGQKLFDLDASGALEASFEVPETVVSRLTVGMPVSIRFTTQDMCVCRGRITEIGKVATKANAFPAKASLLDPPSTARSGMSAEISVLLENEDRVSGYLVPLAAIAPGDTERRGYVFVFDAQSSTVRKTRIRALGARENMVAIEGVKPGDVIAVAGVHFMVDSQKVKLLTP